MPPPAWTVGRGSTVRAVAESKLLRSDRSRERQHRERYRAEQEALRTVREEEHDRREERE